MFSRLGWNDGQEAGLDVHRRGLHGFAGLSMKGETWHRPSDTVGLAGVTNGISRVEQEFLQVGGLGILAGDGNLDYGWEKILETYYDARIWKTIHATADYQFFSDPAFNRARGPVSVFGAKISLATVMSEFDTPTSRLLADSLACSICTHCGPQKRGPYLRCRQPAKLRGARCRICAA